MSTIVLIRHGETDWNIIGRYQGQADPPLNKNGIQQAQQLASALHKSSLDKIYTSPLLRTKQTADLITEKLEVPQVEEPPKKPKRKRRPPKKRLWKTD